MLGIYERDMKSTPADPGMWRGTVFFVQVGQEVGVHVSRCEGHGESIVETQVIEYRFENVVGKLFHLLLAVFSNVVIRWWVEGPISGGFFLRRSI